jgi:hypothetical protein
MDAFLDSLIDLQLASLRIPKKFDRFKEFDSRFLSRAHILASSIRISSNGRRNRGADYQKCSGKIEHPSKTGAPITKNTNHFSGTEAAF